MVHLRPLLLACCFALLALLAATAAAAADGQLGSTPELTPVMPAVPPARQSSPAVLTTKVAQPTMQAGAAPLAQQPPVVAAPTALPQPAPPVTAPQATHPVSQVHIKANTSSSVAAVVATAAQAKPPAPKQSVPLSNVPLSSSAPPPPAPPAPLLPPQAPASTAPSRQPANGAAAAANGIPALQSHPVGVVIAANSSATAAGSHLTGAAGMTWPVRAVPLALAVAGHGKNSPRLPSSATTPPVPAPSLPKVLPVVPPSGAISTVNAAVGHLPAVTAGVGRMVAPAVEHTASLAAVVPVQQRAAASLSQTTGPMVAVVKQVRAPLLPSGPPAVHGTVSPRPVMPIGEAPAGTRQRSVFADQAAARFPSPPHSPVTSVVDGRDQSRHAGTGTAPVPRLAEAGNPAAVPASHPTAARVPPAVGPAAAGAVQNTSAATGRMAERPVTDQAAGVIPTIRLENAPLPGGAWVLPFGSAPALGMHATLFLRSVAPGLPPPLSSPGLPGPSPPPLWGGNGDAATVGLAGGGAGRGHSAVLVLLALLCLLVERQCLIPDRLLSSLASKGPLPAG